ncbi:helix-turn-helix transcriptional regulator [Neoaquamicrobium sediminum]|uniref:helix-turn-helix transcriptional regulator n=1 Tax=Neoaquamicrobium sediminum TaxID=1849104 RepID=UPI001565F655|nr:helix-turn-helix transcriptional regulator [Mesorhizobium sediminum]NRC56559.1 helix-turn-helix transcriptional regulator [Mesorhizobium sediminum]
MEDFASAPVLAMVRRSLARQSIAVPALTAAGERTVDLAEKRALLAGVLDAHGPEAILRVADVVPEFADHPVAGVFAGCRAPSDVVAIWIAIERYFHSRHRTRVVDRDADRIVMEHFDTRGSPISAGENLAVAGLILGILRWRGARDAALRFDGTSSLPDPLATAKRTHRWTIGWTAFEPLPLAPEKQDEVPVPAVDFSGRAVSDPLVARLFAEQLGAPHGRRGADDIARATGLSLRTLQRRLAGAGWSLGDIVASARVHSATRLLASTNTPLALVGLLAGYSDQPHFQRAFRAAVGPTPAEYRKLARPARSV